MCIKFSTHISNILPMYYLTDILWLTDDMQYISNRIWAKFTENESSSSNTTRYNIKLMYSYCKLPLAKLKERIQSAVPKFYVPTYWITQEDLDIQRNKTCRDLFFTIISLMNLQFKLLNLPNTLVLIDLRRWYFSVKNRAFFEWYLYY